MFRWFAGPGPFALALLVPMLAGTLPAQAAGGCDGFALSVQPTGGGAAWSLDVPFDSGFATLDGDAAAGRSVVINESCTPRRVSFDLLPAGSRTGGRCTLVLEGAEATGGCVIGGEERTVTGILRRAGGPGTSRKASYRVGPLDAVRWAEAITPRSDCTS